jgi:hypothetical protein
MLQRNSRSAPRPASDDDVVTRALKIIDPKLKHDEGARQQVVDAIARVARASEHRKPPPYRNSREVHKVTRALRTAMTALEHRLAREVPVGFDPPEKADRLRGELAAFATAVERHYRLIGRRGNVQKNRAAGGAFAILNRYGIEVTLYKGGKFFQLAAALYEGATGIATDSEDLTRACKRIVHHYRYMCQVGLP